MHVFINKFVARFPCHPPLRPFEGWESHKTLITKKERKITMNKKILAMTFAVGCLVLGSCASKKDLENCQNENKELTKNYQDSKEQLAASRARVASLEDQLAQAKKDYAALQGSLDKSLANAGQNNISIEKLVDQINESNQYIRHLVEVKSKSDSLNMVLTNNLTRSLSKE